MALRPNEILLERDDPLDPKRILLVRDGLDLGHTGGGTPTTPQPAEPILLPAGINSNPGDLNRLYCRWQFSNVQLVEGAFGAVNSTRVFNVQLVGINGDGAYLRTSPIDLFINARVTGGTAVQADYHLASAEEAHAAVDFLTLVIRAGATSAGLQVWAKADGSSEGTQDIEITLESTGELSYPLDESTPYFVATSAIAGPSVMTVDIIDSTVPVTPEWRWTGGTALSYPETAGDVFLEISLDGPSSTDVVIEVSDAGTGTGVAGTNYVAPGPGNNRVTIPEGETTGSLRFRLLFDPAIVVGPNPDVDLVGVVVSGNCTDPAADTLTIEMVDVFTAARTLQWAASTLFYPEPEEAGDELTHVIVCTATQAFGAQTDVPFDLTQNNTTAGGGYTISGGVGVPPLHVRFAPQALQGFVRFRPLANGIAGDATVTLTLEDGGSLYGLGSNDDLLITILDNSGGVEERTYLCGPRGVRTGRTVIESTMAVVPPSETLPQYYNFNNGDACQVVGLARNSQGRWDAVRVLAVTDDDIAGGGLGGNQVSYTEGDIGTPIRIALGSGSTPAENNAYHAQSFSGLTFSIVPCNVGGVEYKRTLTDNQATSTTAIKPQWVGPTATDAMFPQVGADLVRTEYYRVVLRETGDVTSDGVTAPGTNSRCMSVECWIKRRVDCDVVEVEGVLTNTNWDKKQTPFTQSARLSGIVNLIKFECQNVPAGWAATWAAATPNESFAGTTITLLPTRAEAYEFSPTATMPFRFALYNTVSSSAAEAQRILRYRHTAISTGHYGVTRNNCWGVMGDLLLDPHRAQYTASWAVVGGVYTPSGPGGPFAVGYVGWRAMEETGQAWVQDVRTGWDNGTAAWPKLDARLGWFQSALPRGVFNPGGGGINGQTACIASVGYWEYSWYALAANIMRQRCGSKDVFSGDEAWQSVLVTENTVTPGFAPVIQSGNQRLGMHRLPGFNTAELVDPALWEVAPYNLPARYNVMQANAGVFTRAPTLRPWNTHAGTADPDRATISHETPTGYQHQDFAHCARYREQIEDGWWGCWSPLAWWNSMHLGAWVSRGLSAHIIAPSVLTNTDYGSQSFAVYDEHFGFIVAAHTSAGAPIEKGRPYLVNPYTNTWWPLENMRGFGHAATVIAQAYAIGGDRQRAFIVEPGGVNWFETWATYMTRFSTPAGMFCVGDGFNINPHDQSQWGRFELDTSPDSRHGAIPRTTSGTGSTFAPHYQQLGMLSHHFVVAGAWAVYWRAIKNQNAQLQFDIKKVLRSLYYVRESNRVWTSEQGNTPLGVFAVAGRGDYVSGSLTQTPTIPDIATYIADYGHDFGSGNGHSEDARLATLYHAPKFGLAVYAWRLARDAEDPERDKYLTPPLCYFSTPNELAPDWEDAFQRGYIRLLAATNAANSSNPAALNPHTDFTFLVPYINEMLNRTT